MILNALLKYELEAKKLRLRVMHEVVLFQGYSYSPTPKFGILNDGYRRIIILEHRHQYERQSPHVHQLEFHLLSDMTALKVMQRY